MQGLFAAGEQELLRANMQAIANLVTASPAVIANVWQPLFPGAFSSIANSHPGAAADLPGAPACAMSAVRWGSGCRVCGPDAAPRLLQDCMSLLDASSTAACQQRRVHTGTWWRPAASSCCSLC